MNVVKVITDCLVITAWLAALVFVVRYAMVRWFATPMGKHAMAFMMACLVILTLASSYIVWPDWGNDGTRQIVRMVCYSLLNLVFWWRVVLLFSGQRGPSHEHPARRAKL